MKLLKVINRRILGQVLAEACIGLSLMVFAWIIITYSLFMANNAIRTEMAARYAAWYQANNGGTPATGPQLDQYFFYQSGLSHVNQLTPVLMGDAFEGTQPTNASDYAGEDNPVNVQVTFGVPAPTSSSPYPFNLLSVHVPLMPNSTLPVYSVQSSCQWDYDSDLWTNASSALSGVWDTLKNDLGSFFSGS
ncbi:MAG TPA: hypothetical protein VGJ73_17695 [Verrucomicrobiae bacterium]|jgi:hypothetical protein